MNTTLPRRTFLRAAGISLGLPMLEVFGREAEVPPKRALFICNTLGFMPSALYPDAPGRAYASTPYLDVLRQHRENFTLFSGLSHPDQGGEHACEMTWLSGARNPGRDGFQNSVSIDQFAARQLGHATRFPSLALSTDRPTSQSYTESGVMIPALDRPSQIFAKLFLKGSPAEVAREQQRLQDGASILDALSEQRAGMHRRISHADRDTLDRYFESVRQAERDLHQARAWLNRPKPVVSVPPPQDLPDKADLVGRIDLLFGLVPLILETDSSRILSIVIQNHHGVPLIEGVEAEHHNLSHHGRDPKKIEQLQRIEGAILACFDRLLTALNDHKEGPGTLLDHSLTLLGSNLGNAAAHDPRNNPILLAGGGRKHGQYVAYDPRQNRPLSDLFLRMTTSLGIEADHFSSSKGVLDWE
ncbi:MAG: hypothetical protein ACI9TH_003464 [Kiritimatiellia bacterium]|jgi:hypothetical protein